jgi:hypothetical protein
MSKLTWKAEDGEVRLAGWESNWLESLPDRFASSMWGIDRLSGEFDKQAISGLVSMLAAGNIERFPYVMPAWIEYQMAGDEDADLFRLWYNFTSSLATVLRAQMDGRLMYRRRRVTVAEVVYNTVTVFGSPLVQFLGRLALLQRQHGFIEAQDRAWAALMLRDGRRQGLLRGYGMWGEVIDFLERGPQGPVVLVHSVEAGFPDPDVACFFPKRPEYWVPQWAAGASGLREWAEMDPARQHEYWDEARHDMFGELPQATRWGMGMTALRERRWSRIGPDTIGAQVFSHMVTIPQVLREAGFLAGPGLPCD